MIHIDVISEEKCSNILCKSLSNCDKIYSIDEVLEMLNMNKQIQQVKVIHPYEIHHTEKSGWFTDVDDPTQPTGKKKIRRATETSFWKAMVEWYIDNNRNATIAELYTEWITWKETPRNKANIKRLNASWKAYYANEPLSKTLINKPVNKISRLELRKWAESLMKKHEPDRKKMARMFEIINQLMEYASDEDREIISENIWQKAKKKINKDLIISKPLPTDESQVFTDEERRELKKMVRDDLVKYKKQSSSAGLQILFLFETALRIGECCGLKWSDIRHNRLYIQRQANNEEVKEWTKSTAGYRDIPLTTEALKILGEVKRFNQEHGYTAEWIFQSSNPDYDYRLSYNAADRKLRKLCSRLDTVIKSPHKCRKTCISTLLDNPDVNNKSVQRFAGHREFTTTNTYYNFDRKSMESQAQAIDQALAI